MDRTEERIVLKEIVKRLKHHVRAINQTYHKKGIGRLTRLSLQQQDIQLMWGLIHDFRLTHPDQDDAIYFPILGKIGKYCYEIREKYIILKAAPSPEVEKQAISEYLALREFVYQLEQMVVKHFYFMDTGTVSRWVMPIGKAAQRSKRSEITIRRYIRNEKIRAYQLAKQWWIPLEELHRIQADETERGTDEHEEA